MALTARTITATFPHGEQVKRRTHRTYTHVVRIFATNEKGKTTTLALNWCGRPDLKDKAVAKANKYTSYGQITVEVAKISNDPWAS